MSDEEDQRTKMAVIRAEMEAEGFTPTAPGPGRIPMDAITGGGEWIGDQGTHELEVDSDVVNGVAREVWGQFIKRYIAAWDAQDSEQCRDILCEMLQEGVLRGYAFGYLTAQQQVRREEQAKRGQDQERKPEK